MRRVSIVTDLRVVKAICRQMNFEVDKVYRYITKDNNHLGNIYYKGDVYVLKYVDGCFYPYLAKVVM